jgi:U3 small nucleolar RNA-associated protein 11
LDHDTVKLLKTQDMGYVVHKKSVDDKKAQKLKDSLHLIGDVRPKLHKIFVDDESQLKDFDLAEHFGTTEEFVDRSFNRPRKETIEKLVVTGAKSMPTTKAMAAVMEKKEKSYKELAMRTRRSKKLEKVVRDLALQRNLMGKGSKRAIKITPPAGSKKRKGDSESKDNVVYKWKRQRQR